MAASDARTLQSLSASIVSNPNQQSQRSVRCVNRFFPLTLCSACPCLPSTLTHIQDWLHLVLVVGVLASVVCVCQMIYEVAMGGSCGSPFCFKQIVSGVCVLPSTVYFIKFIGHYDQQLQEKRKRHQEEVENLIDNINQQVSEMNELCRKVTENANQFATGRFNDKCEHFQRFLKSVKVHYRDLYVNEEMLEELRNFVFAWLRNFAGSLLNPETSPLLKGAKQELSRCCSPQEVCDVTMRRISESRVSFQFQVPAESPFLPRRQRLSITGDAEDAQASSSTTGSVIGDDGAPEGKCGISWFKCGRAGRCGRERSPTSDGMPMTFFLGCCRLKVLSKPHGTLIGAFLLDLALVAFELVEARWPSLLLVIVNEGCVASMLACFEQIDEIAKLEQQIHQYEVRSEEVGKRRDEARKNWEKVQQMHDLWLYRTLPCLSIMGKIHNHLADEDMARREAIADGKPGEDPRPEFLRLANQSLECLEQKLGPLEGWMKGGPLGEEWKQSIGKQLQDTEQCGNIPELLSRLPIITSDLRSLDAPPPSSVTSPLPSPSPSPRG